jgi:hypothetical protein
MRIRHIYAVHGCRVVFSCARTCTVYAWVMYLDQTLFRSKPICGVTFMDQFKPKWHGTSPAKRLSDHRVYSTLQLDINESSFLCRCCSFGCLYACILRLTDSFNVETNGSTEQYGTDQGVTYTSTSSKHYQVTSRNYTPEKCLKTANTYIICLGYVISRVHFNGKVDGNTWIHFLGHITLEIYYEKNSFRSEKNFLIRPDKNLFRPGNNLFPGLREFSPWYISRV